MERSLVVGVARPLPIDEEGLSGMTDRDRLVVLERRDRRIFASAAT